MAKMGMIRVANLQSAPGIDNPRYAGVYLYIYFNYLFGAAMT